jgi:hypothetical protein
LRAATGCWKTGIDKARVDKARVDKAGVDKAGVDKAGVDKAGIDKAGIGIALANAADRPLIGRRLLEWAAGADEPLSIYEPILNSTDTETFRCPALIPPLSAFSARPRSRCRWP